MKAVVSEKGQVTIPKALRDRLGIRPGEELEFTEVRGKLVAAKLHARGPVDEVFGTLRAQGSTDKMLKALRGTPDAVDER